MLKLGMLGGVLGASLLTLGTSLKFGEWAEKHGKLYHSIEAKMHAESNFRAAVKRVEAHNILFSSGESTWKAGLNKFSDLSPEEFLEQHTVSLTSDGQNCSATTAADLPMHNAIKRAPVADSIDWREVGAVSAVKDQGQCGSCWTFSTTGCLESHNFLRNGKMNLLAEQQLVDCGGNYNNFGCSGGLPSQAFEYIKGNGGIDTEDSYTYTAEDGDCKFDANSVGAGVSAVQNITFQDEQQLIDAVGLFGPVSIAYQVASDFSDYESGVYTSTVCSSDPAQVNHAVLAVGYDKTLESESLPYFIVKNSWGTDWGIDGYFYIELGKNMCGLADCASFPVAALMDSTPVSLDSSPTFTNVSHLSTAAVAIGSASSSGTDMYVPFSGGSDLGMLESFDSGATTTYISGVGQAVGALILMAAAASETTVMTGGLLSVGTSVDFGKTFTKNEIAKTITTQDIKYEKSSGIWGIAGPINGLGSVATSSDDAKTFTVHQIKTEPALINPMDIRYASFPSDSTWYATAGFWGDEESARASDGSYRFSKLLSFVPQSNGSVKAVQEQRTMSSQKQRGANDGYSGAWASVVKTVDGGSTWSVIFNETYPAGGLYPNDIHCHDEMTCTFVLDGGFEQPSVFVTTTDGGATWQRTATDEPSTLFAVRMVGEKEAWAGGGDVQSGGMWHSTDLTTWEKQSMAVSDAVFLTSFALDPVSSAFVYATGFLRSNLCSVLKIIF